MKHRLSVASLFVSSYGDQYDPGTQQPPTVLAKNLDRADEIQEQLDECVDTWRSTDGVASDKAMQQAVTDVGKALSLALGSPYALVSNTGDYSPIYDKFGNIIGHDAAAWVKVNGNYLFTQTATAPKLGMYGCVMLGVIPE